MKKLSSENRTLLTVLLTVCVVLCVLFGGHSLLQNAKNRRLTEEYHALKKQIMMLPKTATAEDLEEQGFLNASKLQTEPVDAFWDFYNQEVGSFVFFKEEDTPLTVQLFHFIGDKGYIQVEEWFVADGAWRAEKTFEVFEFNVDRVKGEDGTSELWLRRVGSHREGVFPDWQDYLLYRYTDA